LKKYNWSLPVSFGNVMKYVLIHDVQLLKLGNREGNRSLSHLQGETEGELLQANGAKSRLIHGARGLF